MTPATQTSPPLIIAHRGASGLAPENTLAAFDLALTLGADGVEFDVQLTADERAVVIHDIRLNRTTGQFGFVGGLSTDEISALDAGKWFQRKLRTRPRLRAEVASSTPRQVSARHTRRIETVPTLDQVLHLIGRAPLKKIFVELKGPLKQTQKLLPIVLDSVRLFRMEKVVTIISFDHKVVELASQADKGIRTGALFSIGRPGTISAKSVVRRVREIGAHEAALHFALATPRMIDSLHSEGIPVAIWTVNSKLMMRRLAASGVDAIMTNFPNRLAQVLSEPVAAPRGIAGRLRVHRSSGRRRAAK